jgi:Ca2+-binding RTX toxin-like protein
MKKLTTTLVCATAALLLTAGAAGALNGSGSDMTEQDENAGYNPIPFPFGNDTGLTYTDEEDWSSEQLALDEQAGGSQLLNGTCSGACVYVTSGGVPVEIVCTVPEVGVAPGLVSATGFADPFEGESNRIIMCKHHPASGNWYRVGWCDRQNINKLRVNGMSSSRDTMGIVNRQTNDNGVLGGNPVPGGDCNFQDFENRFESPGTLRMYGNGLYDMVYGSMYDDYRLEGEYVDGRPGDDIIYLTTNEVPANYPNTTAYGGFGSDTITGSAQVDDVWGDPPEAIYKAYGGQEIIRGYAENDYLRGAWWYDQVWGGTGDDNIWGGDETAAGNQGDPDYGDRLYGESGRDNLFGMNGNDYLEGNPTAVEGDFCDGGNHWDICRKCSNNPNCEVIQ